MYALFPARIYTGHTVLKDHAIIIDQGIIQQICLSSELPNALKTYALPHINVAPGFIDLQLNGCGGVMFNAAITVDTLNHIQQTNLKSGCTSYLPTLITCNDQDIYTAVTTMRHYLQQHAHQALGLHLEGPYLNPKRKGIHDPRLIRAPDPALIDYLCQNAAFISQITLAPEMMPISLIEKLHQAGIKIALGHSNATYQQACTGFAAGACLVTHLFNAMSPLYGREPGLIGAALDNPEVYAGIIADGFHLSWPNFRIAQRLKREKLILVTDATAAAGAEIDQFTFVEKQIYVRQGRCVDHNGTLGGSALTMIQAVKNSVLYGGVALEEALRMATCYPARAIGVDDRLGSIMPGKIANLTAFSNDFVIVATVVNGYYYNLG